MTTGRVAKFVSVTAAAALALSACGDGNGTGDGETDAETETGGTIELGIIPSWTDGLSMAHLWSHILEDEGYDVEITEINEAGPLYTGVAQGDIDVYPSAWPEVTHAEYMDEYGDDLEDVGAWYDGAVLTLAVPEYTDVDSLADLNDNADLFGGRIVGIEPGSGHMNITNNEVFPTYELDEQFELVESSTVAMLAELESAVESEEDIVVALWRPYWANAEFPVKDLEDPEGALGEPETLNFIANAGFSEEFPEVAEWMGSFSLDDEQYGELEDLVVNVHDDDPSAGAAEWLENNQEIVDAITG
ncbi:glycine betaine ABC transporter substrate-binding protein [Nesterenkonia suensis]